MKRSQVYNERNALLSLVILFSIYYFYILYSVFIGIYEIDFLHYFIMPIMFVIITWLGQRIFNSKFNYLLLFFMGVNIIIFSPFYSPIDEGAHFDYILHILHDGRIPTLFDSINTQRLSEISGTGLPTGIQYEAVHPPLYYVIAAMVSFLSKGNMLFNFFLLRIFGLFLFIIAYYFSIKTYKNLVQQKLIISNDTLFYVISLCFFLSPGVITRMVTLSNEHLLVPLLSLLIFLLSKTFKSNEISIKLVLLLSLVTGCLLLTKFTSIYVLGVISVYLFFKTRIKYVITYIVTSTTFLVPWLIYNYSMYKSLTGTQLHVNFVKQIVNPTGMKFDFSFVTTRISTLFNTFWNPQESSSLYIDPFQFATSILNSFLFLIILWALIFTCIKFKNFKNSRYVMISTLTLLVGFNLLVLIYGTVSQSVDVMLGRYLSMNIISLIILNICFLQAFCKGRYHLIIGFVILLFVSFLLFNFLLNSIQSKDNLVAKYIKSTVNSVSLENIVQLKEYGVFANKDLGETPIILGGEYSESVNKGVISEKRILLKDKNATNGVSLTLDEIKITGYDPYVSWILDNQYSPNKNDVFVIRMGKLSNSLSSNPIKGQLFWDNGTGYSEDNSYIFDVKEDRTMIVPVGTHQSWNNDGYITEIRFDIDGLTINDSFVLDSISIERLIN